MVVILRAVVCAAAAAEDAVPVSPVGLGVSGCEFKHTPPCLFIEKWWLYMELGKFREFRE